MNNELEPALLKLIYNSVQDLNDINPELVNDLKKEIFDLVESGELTEMSEPNITI